MFDEYDQEFTEESIELIETAQSLLIKVEGASAVLRGQYDEEILRTLHTLKGACGMFGLSEIEKALHHFEEVYLQASKIKKISSDTIDYVLKGLDAVRKSLTSKEEYQYASLGANEELVNTKLEKKEEQEHTRPSKPLLFKTLAAKAQEPKPLVYVVEDKIELRSYIIELMESLDFECRGFDNPLLALELIKEDDPDLVLTDINMPEMDGMSFISQIYPDFPHLPVIIISGHVTKNICIEFLSYGAAGILEKPFDPDNLLSMASLNIKRYQAYRLLGRSIRYMQYQFSDLENFLLSNGLHSVCETLREEMKSILMMKRSIDKKVK